ncbi:hypothetical protein QBC41DRAFT_355261 [Cercophora samala]|uniref:BTB domain-containing protein n=1 Tax=Cercophora samala TaxID=330535 RepID=A0AA40DCH4_9PEZI|nr:hypothetical protein QBC41DRAFT_355261 [Cercophora samala]
MSSSTVEKRYLHCTSYNEAVVSDNYSFSPFSSPLTSLKFRNGICLTAHREFLIQSPKLVSLITRHDSFPETISLPEVSYAAGQILVAHLYTGRWMELAWFGPEGGLEDIAKLETAFEVYLAARKYELCSLEALAQIHIEQDAARLDIFTVIDVAKRVYPVPDSNDTWFQQHIKSRIKADFDKPDSALLARLDTNFADESSIIKLVLKGMLEAYREKTEALARQAAAMKRPCTPSSDGSFEEVECPSPRTVAESKPVTCSKEDNQTSAAPTAPPVVLPTEVAVEVSTTHAKPPLDKSVYETAPEALEASHSDAFKPELPPRPVVLVFAGPPASQEPTVPDAAHVAEPEPEVHVSDNNSNSNSGGGATTTGIKVKKCKHKLTKARWECKACGKCTRPSCVSCKCRMCRAKCREESHRAVSEPVVEPEVPEVVPEVVPAAEPAPAQAEDEGWDFAGTSSKNSARNVEIEAAVVVVEPESEPTPVPEVVPEPQPIVEDVPRDSLDMANNDRKKEAKKGKQKAVVRPETEAVMQEIEPIPLMEPAPVPKSKPSMEDSSWGFPSTKFTKKKAKAVVGTGSEPVSETGNAQLIAEIERGFPQGGWDFWGTSKKR